MIKRWETRDGSRTAKEIAEMEANKVTQAKNGTPPAQAAIDMRRILYKWAALTRADKAGEIAPLFEGTEELEVPVIPAEFRARMDAQDRAHHARIVEKTRKRIAERRLQKHLACALIYNGCETSFQDWLAADQENRYRTYASADLEGTIALFKSWYMSNSRGENIRADQSNNE